MVIDFAEVTLADASAAHMIEGLAHKAQRRGVAVYLTGASAELRRSLLAQGLRRHWCATRRASTPRLRPRAAAASLTDGPLRPPAVRRPALASRFRRPL
jgi:MFS superfamily sulfate permease-like transporter